MADMEYKVEFGYGSNWRTPDGFAWTDATLDVRKESGIRTRRGRSTELQNDAAGYANFAVNNPDRQYDPLYADGPHYGDLKNGIPVRVSGVVNGGAAKPIMRGFLRGLPQRYLRGNRFSVVPMRAVDGFERVADALLPPTVYDYYIGLDNPLAYWKCDDNSEASLADSSGNSHDGVWDNVTFGQDPLCADEGKSVQVPLDVDAKGRVYGQLITAYPATFEAWVKFPRDLTQHHTFIGVARDAALGSWVWFACFGSAAPPTNTDGCLGMWLSGGRGVRGSTRIDDDVRHHVVAVVNSATSIDLYVDGVAETETTFEAGTGLTPTNHYLYGIGNMWDVTTGDFAIGGLIDNLAIYNTALTSDQVFLHWLAGNFSWGGDRSDTRITRILDIVEWPANLRDLEVGDAVLDIQNPVFGGSALAYMKRVETTEQGRLFISKDGEVRFLNRYHWTTVPSSSTSQVTLDECDYMDVEIDHTDTLVINHITGNREGGPTLEVADQDSIDEHGDQGDTLSNVLLATDSQVRDLMLYRLGRYKDEQTRVGPIAVSLDGVSNTLAEAILDLELGDRITVRRTPQDIGDPIEVEVLIESIDHSITKDGWVVTFDLSPVDTSQFGVWGAGLWGSARWAA